MDEAGGIKMILTEEELKSNRKKSMSLGKKFGMFRRTSAPAQEAEPSRRLRRLGSTPADVSNNVIQIPSKSKTFSGSPMPTISISSEQFTKLKNHCSQGRVIQS